MIFFATEPLILSTNSISGDEFLLEIAVSAKKLRQ